MKKNRTAVIGGALFLTVLLAAAWGECFRQTDFYTGQEITPLLLFAVCSAVIFVNTFVDLPALNLSLVLIAATAVNIISMRHSGVFVLPLAQQFLYKNVIRKSSTAFSVIAVMLNVFSFINFLASIVYNLHKSNIIIPELKSAQDYIAVAFLALPTVFFSLLFRASFSLSAGNATKQNKGRKYSKQTKIDVLSEKLHTVYLTGAFFCITSIPFSYYYCYYYFTKTLLWCWLLLLALSAVSGDPIVSGLVLHSKQH